jgi:Cactus-binding C-terminus of cactin protein
MDNPPPKVVQGYKFNIFYPDLIDKVRNEFPFKASLHSGATKFSREH